MVASREYAAPTALGLGSKRSRGPEAKPIWGRLSLQ
jgi:hypothetical protein